MNPGRIRIRGLRKEDETVPRISIIVPVYKTDEVFLHDCFTSLCAQTDPDIEILLVEDGSPDNCGAICDDYARKDKRVVVIHKENGGVSSARNLGIEKASSDWIMFVDADDWVEPDMCKIISNHIRDDIDIIMWTSADVIAGNKKPNRAFNEKFLELETEDKEEVQLKAIVTYSPNFIYSPNNLLLGGVWCKLYRRTFLESKQLKFNVNLVHAEDSVFNLYAYEYARKIIYFDKILYYRRMHAASAVQRYRPKAINSFNESMQEIYKFIEIHKKPEEFYNAYNTRYLDYLLLNAKVDIWHPDNHIAIFERFAQTKKIYSNSKYKHIIHNVKYKSINKKVRRLALFFLKNNCYFLFSSMYLFKLWLKQIKIK